MPGTFCFPKHVAEDLEEYEQWRPLLHDLGACEVKHGVRVSVVNLYADQVGNAKLPRKFETVQKRGARRALGGDGGSVARACGDHRWLRNVFTVSARDRRWLRLKKASRCFHSKT